MKVLVVGGTGRIGTAVVDALTPGNEVVVASRLSTVGVDIGDAQSITALFERTGTVDAVVCTAGATPFPVFADTTTDHFREGFDSKLLGQIDLVLRGIPHVRDGGSFTLISGVLGREPVASGVVASTINGALESFVTAAATELPRGLRINAVSPSVVTESLDVYGDYFPGFTPVPVADVARAFVKSVHGIQTGQVYELG